MHNKMVIEPIFLWWASDFVLPFLAFLQHWHSLSRQGDRNWLGSMMDAMTVAARRLASSGYGRDGVSYAIVPIAYTFASDYGGAATYYGQ